MNRASGTFPHTHCAAPGAGVRWSRFSAQLDAVRVMPHRGKLLEFKCFFAPGQSYRVHPTVAGSSLESTSPAWIWQLKLRRRRTALDQQHDSCFHNRANAEMQCQTVAGN